MRFVRLTALAIWIAASAQPAFAADAIPTGKSGLVALGPRWGVYETYKGVSFRWIGNDAQIFVRGGPGLARLTIACGGGPSLGQAVFPLRVLDTQGRQVDHAQCSGKDQPAQLILPVAAGVTTYVLHVDGGGRPVRGERRILNAQVFSLDDSASAAAPDVAGDGIRFADRWEPVETYQGETFRWMDGNGGRIVISSARDTRATVRPHGRGGAECRCGVDRYSPFAAPAGSKRTVRPCRGGDRSSYPFRCGAATTRSRLR